MIPGPADDAYVRPVATPESVRGYLRRSSGSEIRPTCRWLPPHTSGRSIGGSAVPNRRTGDLSAMAMQKRGRFRERGKVRAGSVGRVQNCFHAEQFTALQSGSGSGGDRTTAQQRPAPAFATFFVHDQVDL